jgi:hypothetical protein
MIVGDQLDRGRDRIGRVEMLEEFNELAAASAVFDESMDLAGQQIDASQQTERAKAPKFVIPGEGRMDAGFGRQIGSRRRDGLEPAFRRTDRSRPTFPCSTWRGLFSAPRLHDRRREPRPFSVRTRHRDFQDSSAPCEA